MPTLIIAVLIVLAAGVLLSSWVGARRDRDPASSVQTFHRAMDAMGGTSAQGRSFVRTVEDDADADELPASRPPTSTAGSG